MYDNVIWLYTCLSEKKGIGTKAYMGKKKVCTISSDCIGYKEFVKK